MEKIQDIGCNNATAIMGNYFTGNVIPNNWYKKITTNSGRPDLSSIAILAEIVYWYRPGKDGERKFKSDAWQTSYEYFENKFGYNRQKIRRTFVRLEELGYIRRDIRIVRYYGQKYGNVLFIHLLDELLLGTKSLSNVHKDRKKISSSDVKNEKPLLQNCSNNIDIETKKEKNRSNSFNSAKRKPIKDFYPLSDYDLKILRANSGREFDLNAANEILLSISNKLPTHGFFTHESFLNYMSKVLSNELRQAQKINNESFRINRNKNDEEIFVEKKEKFLMEIENSSATTDMAILKRKLAGSLGINEAYNVIRSLRTYNSDGIITTISFDGNLKLSKSDEDIILREAGLIAGNSQIEIEFSKEENFVIAQDSISEKTIDHSPIWQNVRNKAKEVFGNDVDRAWFSRLKAIVDEKNKSVKLKADTGFIRDWVDNNYKNFLTSQMRIDGFILEEVY